MRRAMQNYVMGIALFSQVKKANPQLNFTIRTCTKPGLSRVVSLLDKRALKAGFMGYAAT
jgi:hypothetical protein